MNQRGEGGQDDLLPYESAPANDFGFRWFLMVQMALLIHFGAFSPQSAGSAGRKEQARASEHV
jgi:hypothetical protein